MLPLFIITMLLTIPMLSVTNNCDTIGQTELYYENAENLDSWTEYYNLPAGEYVYAYQTYPIDYVCKKGSCFWLSDDNYYDSGTFAELVSDPITTIGYSNIEQDEFVIHGDDDDDMIHGVETVGDSQTQQ
eukprot:682106_1